MTILTFPMLLFHWYVPLKRVFVTLFACYEMFYLLLLDGQVKNKHAAVFTIRPSDESEYPCLVPNLRREYWNFSLWVKIMPPGSSRAVNFIAQMLISCSILVESFYHQKMLNSIKRVFSTYWTHVFYILHSMNRACHIITLNIWTILVSWR